MKYCTNCRRLSPGDPLFCTQCGRTYDVRLCPRHHPNGRGADVCSECGSRDLTQPAPRRGLSGRLVPVAARLVIVSVIVIVPIVLMLGMVHAVLADAQLQLNLVGLLLIGAGGWWAWNQLPGVIRSGLRSGVRSMRRKSRDRH
jgi:hypothetical protein